MIEDFLDIRDYISKKSRPILLIYIYKNVLFCIVVTPLADGNQNLRIKYVCPYCK